jgi:dihydroxyacid dehydratase/phosphogluconate dehydratase
VVFSSLDDLSARIDDPALDVAADDFLVLQNAGPKSGYAMPEAGYLPIPAKLARAGVKDMVRISDARMSGTAFGSIVLHVTPEAAIGGPLAAVRNGDRIAMSVANKRLDLMVNEDEISNASQRGRRCSAAGLRVVVSQARVRAPDAATSTSWSVGRLRGRDFVRLPQCFQSLRHRHRLAPWLSALRQCGVGRASNCRS